MVVFELFETFLFYCGIFSCVLFLSIYAYFKYSYTYWSSKGVPYLKPKFPLGNNVVIGKAAPSYGMETVAWYNELKRKGHKFGGAWSWAKPVLVLTDTEYVKDVLLKDFQYFMDRDFYHNPKFDPKSESIFTAEKEEWRTIRQRLTPTFTSAKIKMMFDNVLKCSNHLIDFMENVGTGADIDLKQVMWAFTIEVIGCVAFGLEPESFKKDSKFKQMGLDIFKPGLLQSIRLIMSRVCGKTAQKIGIINTPEHITEFFADVVRNNVEYRKKNNVKRSDFIDLLMEIQEATKNDEKPFSFEEFVGNVILFFFAGFDTSAITMSMALYELAQNLDVQERARTEIQGVIKKHNGVITYEAYQEMTYLRQVIDETLRLYPPVPTLSRVAIKPYKFQDTDFTLETGTTVLIPAMALGRDPQYFPEPEKFNPDRFSAEHKASINSWAYLPFGEGPRNCIGMRFGLMQSSIGLIRILERFRITISPSTNMPLTMMDGSFTLQTNETLYVKAEKIK